MFRHYVANALRNIISHKLYSIISIVGLAVGLTCAILITLFVRDELSYDKWIPGSDQLWRVEVTYHLPGRTGPMIRAQAPFPIPAAMAEQIPEVTSATRLAGERLNLTSPEVPDRQFSEVVGVVDPNFIQVIKLPLVEGDPRTALAQPDNLVISQSAARKYFGAADPIGKTLTTGRGDCSDATCANTTVALRVVGVMRDLPQNTQFAFDFLMPNSSLADHVSQDDKKCWICNDNNFGYVTLAPGANPEDVVAKLKPALDRNIDISAATNIKVSGSQLVEVRLTHFRDAHLTTDRYGALKPAGSWTTIYGMMVIGALILLVAAFNFMNLATARATMRAREISLRKCMGARRGQLVVQFLVEATLMALTALILAFALVEVLLPAYGRFMGGPLRFNVFSDWPLTLALLGIAIITGLVSGLYPALVLSAFRPASARVNGPGGGAPGRVRTGLIVLQFAVSIGLGCVALIVFQQIQFARHIDLGFRRDNIVFTSTAGHLTEEGTKSFIQALARGPGILQVVRTGSMPFDGSNSVFPVQRPSDAEFLSPNGVSVSEGYFRLFGIKLLAGRALQDNREEDKYYETENFVVNQAKNEGHNIMVNASLARALGYKPADIVGKIVIVKKTHIRVVGVVADTLFEGVRSQAQQMAYVHNPDDLANIVIRIAPGSTQEALGYINRVSRTFVHGVVLSPSFLDDNYARLYAADRRQGAIFGIFVALAIFIACFGLFGLAAFTAGRRTKEIGIRRVFGARNGHVIRLLLWQFSIPVLMANLIAWPIAWYYLHGWLQGFAYRITLNPLYFAVVGLVALLIAWATILGHALSVARANPIHALRHE